MSNSKAPSRAYTMPVEPIILKELILGVGIPQQDLADLTGIARPTFNLCVNRGYIPACAKASAGKPDPNKFKKLIENHIKSNRAAMHWLLERGLKVEDIWTPACAQGSGGQGSFRKSQKFKGFGERVSKAMHRPAFIQGDPLGFTPSVEVEMISAEAQKHFKIFRNPFIDDIQADKDIYMSEEHRYIEAAMVDAARHGGFLAVIGEVGSGKSVMRRKVVEQLRKDGDVLIIFPQIIDKTRLNASSICDAIIMDISSDKPRIKLEQKTRQCHKLLLERSKQNFRSVLMIEEAHDLSIPTLKYLKRFYEMEDGYRKLLGIVLIGQTELKDIFSEAQHVDMREVIRRVQVAEISGLNGHIKEYLNLKFKRVGAEIDKVFAPEAITALGKRLTTKDRNNKTISHAFPLLVNNYAAKAMNLAAEMGEGKVSEEIILSM